MLSELSARSRDIFRTIVEAYVETGEPVGSRTLSRRLGQLTGGQLSPATIRNVMADLEELGLLFAPHTSAGRLPTDLGLRLFVDGLMETGGLTEDDRAVDRRAMCGDRAFFAGSAGPGDARCCPASRAAPAWWWRPRSDRPLKHIEFVHLAPGRALVVMVTEGGMVENRIVDVPLGLPSSALIEATNYLTTRLAGRTLGMGRDQILGELETERAMLDQLTKQVVEAGLASWSKEDNSGALIVRGQAHLLDDVTGIGDLERLRSLFAALETKEQLLKLVEAAEVADGVQIYIGAENDLFGLAGCSAVISPYRDSQRRLVGAIGVIGPSRINYARIIPMVDYTAKVDQPDSRLIPPSFERLIRS